MHNITFNVNLMIITNEKPSIIWSKKFQKKLRDKISIKLET